MKTTSKIAFKHIGLAILAYWIVILIITGFYQRTTDLTSASGIAAAIFSGMLLSAVKEAYSKGKQDAHKNETQ